MFVVVEEVICVSTGGGRSYVMDSFVSGRSSVVFLWRSCVTESIWTGAAFLQHVMNIRDWWSPCASVTHGTVTLCLSLPPVYQFCSLAAVAAVTVRFLLLLTAGSGPEIVKQPWLGRFFFNVVPRSKYTPASECPFMESQLMSPFFGSVRFVVAAYAIRWHLVFNHYLDYLVRPDYF